MKTATTPPVRVEPEFRKELEQALQEGTGRETASSRGQLAAYAMTYGAPDRRSVTASERMKRAHEGAAYNAWLRKQVQASIEDPRPSVSAGDAQAQMAARRKALARKAGGAGARKAKH